LNNPQWKNALAPHVPLSDCILAGAGIGIILTGVIFSFVYLKPGELHDE
jgi:hypothetical protein